MTIRFGEDRASAPTCRRRAATSLLHASAARSRCCARGHRAGYAQDSHGKKGRGRHFLEIDEDITLRRMVVHNPKPKGTVLFLHGFPETLYAWKDISLALADDYEVHAFDWPGYGLSSRPTADRFSYAPRDYARVLDDTSQRQGSTRRSSRSTQRISAPCRRFCWRWKNPTSPGRSSSATSPRSTGPNYMYESLQSLKAGPAMDQARAQLNKNRDEILENAFTRGLPEEAQFDVSREFKDDMSRGWNQGAMTTADAFSHYYSHFTRDQDALRIATRPAQDPGEGGLGRERPLHQEGNGRRVRRKDQRRAHASSRHWALPPPAEPEAEPSTRFAPRSDNVRRLRQHLTPHNGCFPPSGRRC